MNQAIKKSALMLLCVVALSGCGKITLKIDLNPESKTFNFSETFILETVTQQYLGILVRPGADDFWQRLAEMAKKNGWQFKERSANQLDVSGAFSMKDPGQATSLLSRQLSFVAEGYGAGIEKVDTTLVPVALSVTKHQDFLYTYYDAKCKYDLSLARIAKQLHGASSWPNFTTPPVRFPIEVEVKAPYEVTACSGQINSENHTCKWTIYSNESGTATVSYRALNKEVVLALLAAIGVSVLGVALAIYRGRVQEKKSVEQKTEAEK